MASSLLTRSIAAGEWPPGAALPSETRLAERFNVSIGTLRKAIDELVAERMVVRQQGRGTFVATHGSSRLLFHFFHIVPRGGEKQYPHTRTLGFRRNPAGPDEARKLGLGPGEPVLRVRPTGLCASPAPNRYQYQRSGSSPRTSTCAECAHAGSAVVVPEKTMDFMASSSATSQRSVVAMGSTPVRRVHSTMPSGDG
ncbi:MAG: hypothetical protein A3G28_03075 [Betaproteobacteria bacterium RIFCSPLOWO2_12_FULL_68_19]|nr:MAG: hypothetical protein A3G28_03075 [Betaproteobacteria bacterium RIFCSPLOWO2_12_FULL_68_19]